MYVQFLNPTSDIEAITSTADMGDKNSLLELRMNVGTFSAFFGFFKQRMDLYMNKNTNQSDFTCLQFPWILRG